jgi:hypothetical protein
MVSRISQSTNRPTTVAEIRLEQQKTEKISSILRTGERKGWTIFERIDNPDSGAGMICRLSNRRRHDKVSWVLPDGGGTIPPCYLVMNKQSTLDQDQKRRRSRVKLHDLPAKKNLKGGSSANQRRPRTDRLKSQGRFRNFLNAILCRSSQTDFFLRCSRDRWSRV